MVSYHPDPPQLLRARLRLALHSRGGDNLNRLVHHERGRYCSGLHAHLNISGKHVRAMPQLGEVK